MQRLANVSRSVRSSFRRVIMAPTPYPVETALLVTTPQLRDVRYALGCGTMTKATHQLWVERDPERADVLAQRQRYLGLQVPPSIHRGALANLDLPSQTYGKPLQLCWLDLGRCLGTDDLLWLLRTSQRTFLDPRGAHLALTVKSDWTHYDFRRVFNVRGAPREPVSMRAQVRRDLEGCVLTREEPTNALMARTVATCRNYLLALAGFWKYRLGILGAWSFYEGRRSMNCFYWQVQGYLPRAEARLRRRWLETLLDTYDQLTALEDLDHPETQRSAVRMGVV